jgi:hypothetical protein
VARVARGHVDGRPSTLVYVLAILAAGAALSRYGLGSLWHPPANSPFGVPSQSQFSQAVNARLPGSDVLAYRQIGGAAVGVASEGNAYSIFEARYDSDHKVQFTGQSEEEAGSSPLSVTQVWNSPAVLVAYVNSPSLADRAVAASVLWSTNTMTRIDLAGSPRAWIVPPPSNTEGRQPQWRRIVLYDRYARPIVIVQPALTQWVSSTPTLSPGAFTMPSTTSF